MSLIPMMVERSAGSALDRYRAAIETGYRVRWAREQQGVTQRELGAALGLSHSTVHRIEKGERRLTPAELAITARVVGVPLGLLKPTNGNGAAA